MSKRSIATAAKNINSSKQPKHWSFGLLESMKDPDSVVKKTKQAVVITDKYPKAKIHYLVLPQDDINSIYNLDKSHIGLLEEFGELFMEIQYETELPLRAGFHAVPSMQRLHMHIISSDMVSPCLKTKQHWNSFTTDNFKPFADVLAELIEKGSIEKMSHELHKSLMSTELQCNQCSHKPKNMPQLKEHLLTHIKKYIGHLCCQSEWDVTVFCIKSDTDCGIEKTGNIIPLGFYAAKVMSDIFDLNDALHSAEFN